MKTIYKKCYYLLVLIPFLVKVISNLGFIKCLELDSNCVINATLVSVIIVILIEITIMIIRNMKFRKNNK